MSVLRYMFVNFDVHNFTGFGDLMDVSKRFTRNAKQFSICQKEGHKSSQEWQVRRWDSVVECEGSSHKSECIASNDM